MPPHWYERLALLREVRRCEAILRETLPSEDEAAVLRAGSALFDYGEALFALGRYQEAADRLQKADELLWSLPSFAAAALFARLRKSNALALLGRFDQALDIVQQVISLGVVSPRFPELMPLALSARVAYLEELGRPDDAYRAAQELIDTVSPSATVQQRLLVARAFIMQAKISRSRREPEQALAALDDAIALCLGQDDPCFGPERATAMVHRASVLEDLGRVKDAIDAFDEITARFGAYREAFAKVAVREARERKATYQRAASE